MFGRIRGLLPVQKQNSIAWKWILLPWCVFVSHGVLWIASTPPGSGFDEPFHLAMVEQMGESLALPVIGQSRFPVDLRSHLISGPLPQHAALAMRVDHLSYWDYWQRAVQGEEVAGIGGQPDRSLNNIQAQHPPLYYLICAPVLKLFGGSDWSQRFVVLRLFSLLLASLTIPLAAFVFEQVAGSARLAVLGCYFIALLPVVMPDVARVGNDGLGIPLFTAVLLTFLLWLKAPHSLRWAGAVGMLLGIGLITKAYFLTACPAVVLAFWFLSRETKKRRAVALGVFLFAVLIVSGWWYVRNLLVYGSFSGLVESVGLAAGQGARPQMLDALFSVPWHNMASNLFRTHVWVGGWSFLKHFLVVYGLFAVLYLAALVGWLRVWRGRHLKDLGELAGLSWKAVAALAACAGFFVLGLAYQRLVNFMFTGGGGSGGWYLVCLVSVEGLFVSIGLLALLPDRFRRWGEVGLVAFLGGVSLTGIWLVNVPYYAGLTRLANDTGTLDFSSLHPWSFSTWQTAAERISHLSLFGSWTTFTMIVCSAVSICCCVAGMRQLRGIPTRPASSEGVD